MNKTVLQEYLSPSAAQTSIMLEESIDAHGNKGKSLYMKGIFIQGGVRNHNERVYPVDEIKVATKSIMDQIDSGYSVLGEVDHPEDLKINLDRVSHQITHIEMDGANGIGKLKILPTPMGKLIETMLESGVKLGVSSRGSGNVGNDGQVSGFEIVTVDVVAQPSAPAAYPTAIYEGLMNMKYGHKLFELAADPKAQKYLEKAVISLIKEMKIK